MARKAPLTASKRYAAKLLFQFRVEIDGHSGKRRVCEERIVNFQARSPREAMKTAKRYGAKAEYAYRNSDNNPIFFEFVGVVDLMELGVECGDEVWYDIRERLLPMERRDRLIPTDEQLLANMRRDR